jgi:uncharacterized protein (DUF2062 family)
LLAPAGDDPDETVKQPRFPTRLSATLPETSFVLAGNDVFTPEHIGAVVASAEQAQQVMSQLSTSIAATARLVCDQPRIAREFRVEARSGKLRAPR